MIRFRLQRTIGVISSQQHRDHAGTAEAWRLRSPEERLAAVEFLRNQHGSGARLQRVLRLLNEHRVEFVIVGAYALAFHGRPRFTGDFDIFVRPTVANGERLVAAIAAFGCPTDAFTPSDIAEGHKVIQMP